MAVTQSNSRHRASRDRALGLRFLVLAIASIVLLVMDSKENHLNAIRAAVGAMVYPLRVLVDLPGATWRWIGDNTASRHELQLENSRLNAERLLSSARLQRFAALEAENERLRAMLEATERVRMRVRVAEVMSVNTNPFEHTVVINKGSRDNVYVGQALIDPDGVLGQITKTELLSSHALLISDPDHTLPVEVNRNGVRTVAFGTGQYDTLSLPFLPNNADIVEGDLLVTSGLGGDEFPAGYPVAIVENVERVPEEPFARVTARPQAALGQVRELMLVWMENAEGEAVAVQEDSAVDNQEDGEGG